MRPSSGFQIMYLTPTNAVAKRRLPYNQRPAGRTGCEWFDHCDKCRFPDCEASQINMSYNSKRGTALRARTIARAIAFGASAEEMEQFFRLPEGKAQELAAAATGLTIRFSVSARSKAIIDMRAGIPVETVSHEYGVTERTLRTWMAANAKLPAPVGNRHA